MAFALLIALLLTVTAAIVGGYIKRKIWNKDKPNSANGYGRVWAAYVAFIVPLSAINLFIRKDFWTALFGFFISLIIFPAIAFVFGYVYGLVKTNNHKINGINSDSAYETALNELEDASYIKSIWARSLAKCDGDEAKARSLYIKLRSTDLLKEKQIYTESIDSKKFPEVTVENTGKIKFITIAFVILCIVLFFILNSNKFNEHSPAQYSSQQVDQVQRPVFSEPKITEPVNVVDELIPSLIGQWRCISGEDVIDTYESNGIYRRLWVKQQTEFVYKWKIVKENDDFILYKDEVDGKYGPNKSLILKLSDDQFEVVLPSGTTQKCKVINPIKKNTTLKDANPLLKKLIGVWKQSSSSLSYKFKSDGSGSITSGSVTVCATFKYSLNGNRLFISRKGGLCLPDDLDFTLLIQIDGDSMTTKAENSYIGTWQRVMP